MFKIPVDLSRENKWRIQRGMIKSEFGVNKNNGSSDRHVKSERMEQLPEKRFATPQLNKRVADLGLIS
ncbi:hypothetical protein BpJC4_00250 [Weizmannia acidilactici]|nr:hypothetical protein BpJC4_00250 [Weizmannia acidilactici]